MSDFTSRRVYEPRSLKVAKKKVTRPCHSNRFETLLDRFSLRQPNYVQIQFRLCSGISNILIARDVSQHVHFRDRIVPRRIPGASPGPTRCESWIAVADTFYRRNFNQLLTFYCLLSLCSWSNGELCRVFDCSTPHSLSSPQHMWVHQIWRGFVAFPALGRCLQAKLRKKRKPASSDLEPGFCVLIFTPHRSFCVAGSPILRPVQRGQ